MTKIFYWHLVELTPIKTELVSRGVKGEDLTEILDHLEEIIHHRVLSLVFGNLPLEHHRELTLRLAKNPQGRDIWNFLKEKSKKDLSGEVEKNIREIISEIINDLEFDKQ